MDFSKSDRKRRRSATGDAVTTSKRKSEAGGAQSTKKAKVEERRSIFVRSLPPNATTESLADFFSQHFPVKHAVVVADQKTKESRGFGFVTFADADDAKSAQTTLDKKEWDGRRIRVDIAEPRQRNPESGSGDVLPAKHSKAHEEFQKPPKLIVRNLPWSIKTSDQLASLFKSFGKVRYADLPQTKGKLKGFGFVTIRGKPNAEKALEAINGKTVDGRTLAVDWAVDKSTWDEQHSKENEPAEASDGGEGEEEDDDEDEDESESGDAPEDEEAAVPKNRDEQLDADLANFMKNYMQNMEDEDEDNEEENNDDNEDEDDLDIELGDDHEKVADSVQPHREKSTDNSSTVFVRNLPFTTTDEQLKSFFGHFGNIRYARVVVDKVTERPAGTGFVCFVDKAEAKTCIVGAPRRTLPTAGVKNSILQDENSDPTGKYTLDGRVLQIVQAVNKDEAGNLAESSLAKRREKDKRKLYLLAEGAIGQNSPLHGLLTPAEVRMRQASAVQRKKMVQKNPMLHVSLTRLALRNIPRDIGSRELKELARKAVVGFAMDVKEGRRQPLSKEENARDGKDAKEKEKERKLKKKGIIRQAKVVFEDTKGSKVTETSGAGKSRGYGFIEYASHRWALMGLRYLNGHQLEGGDNGKKQRLIAEFAIENAQVVQRRQAAEEKSVKAAQEKNKGEKNNEPVPEKEASGPKGKKQHQGKKGKKAAGKEPKVEEEEIPKPTNAKEAMQQKLIGRKRLMRKKKAVARGKR
ncbi:Nucleolar protein 4 [Cladobotryum mycophilum]|uniref:Nucleolar protein 4 n=1 Tax=Cladobotryum mycophilum TaxID=491253 RepID=A0ABR0SZY2_9HYPO